MLFNRGALLYLYLVNHEEVAVTVTVPCGWRAVWVCTVHVFPVLPLPSSALGAGTVSAGR